jgi:RimJ/RimL family protein N-acetyltransferase
MTALKTGRLLIDELSFDDTEFIVELLNDESFLRFIGDKGVRTIEDAHKYLQDGPMQSYRRNGFGLLLVRRASDGAKLGMCGLVRREGLDHPDLGFAFLPEYRAYGYAFESAFAVLNDARSRLGIDRILGICNPDNGASIALLTKAGFCFEKQLRLSADAEPVNLYSTGSSGTHIVL